MRISQAPLTNSQSMEANIDQSRSVNLFHNWGIVGLGLRDAQPVCYSDEHGRLRPPHSLLSEMWRRLRTDGRVRLAGGDVSRLSVRCVRGALGCRGGDVSDGAHVCRGCFRERVRPGFAREAGLVAEGLSGGVSDFARCALRAAKSAEARTSRNRSPTPLQPTATTCSRRNARSAGEQRKGMISVRPALSRMTCRNKEPDCSGSSRVGMMSGIVIQRVRRTRAAVMDDPFKGWCLVFGV